MVKWRRRGEWGGGGGGRALGQGLARVERKGDALRVHTVLPAPPQCPDSAGRTHRLSPLLRDGEKSSGCRAHGEPGRSQDREMDSRRHGLGREERRP